MEDEINVTLKTGYLRLRVIHWLFLNMMSPRKNEGTAV